jgi:hypothetical protein
MRRVDAVVNEIVELRRLGFRFIALADDNFYPVPLSDLAAARRRADPTRLHELEALRQERFELMERLAALPDDLIFYTQITMEAAEDPEFLTAMRRAHIRGALVGVESVTPEGLKDIYKGFNLSGDELVTRLREFRRHDIHVLGSFIFGLPSDREQTFDTTLELAKRAKLTFAQFVLLTPFPGTVDFEKWARTQDDTPKIDGVSVTQHWLIPEHRRPKIFSVGSLLRMGAGVVALGGRVVAPLSARVRARVQAVPADVRQHGHCDRQRARRAIGHLGQMDRPRVPALVHGPADATPERTGGADPDSNERSCGVTRRTARQVVVVVAFLRRLFVGRSGAGWSDLLSETMSVMNIRRPCSSNSITV